MIQTKKRSLLHRVCRLCRLDRRVLCPIGQSSTQERSCVATSSNVLLPTLNMSVGTVLLTQPLVRVVRTLLPYFRRMSPLVALSLELVALMLLIENIG